MLAGSVAVSTATLPAESSASPPSTLTSTSTSICSSSSPSRPARRTLIVDPREQGKGASLRMKCASDILRFRSIEDAVAAAAEGDVVALVAPGSGETVVHAGRAVLSKPGITLTTLGYDLNDNDNDDGASPAPSPQSKEGVLASAGPRTRNGSTRATLSHETSLPYQSTVSVSAPRCRVLGLTIRHSSPSVANNYALHVEEGAAAAISDSEAALTVISECDVASSSGTALGLDSPARVSRSRLFSNTRFGASVFAPGPPRTKIFRCELVGGGGKGVKGDVSGGSGGLLVRGGDIEIRECFLSGNPFAMRLVDGTGFVSRCAVGKGKVEEGVAWEGEMVRGGVKEEG